MAGIAPQVGEDHEIHVDVRRYLRHAEKSAELR